MSETRLCLVCDTPFEPKNKHHRFCSIGCRKVSEREAKFRWTEERLGEAFQWDPVRAAASVRVSIVRHKLPKTATTRTWKRAVVLPDPQFGFWRDSSGQLQPVHDEHALAIARQVTALSGAETAVWLGDLLDFPEFSKYQKSPSFVETAQPAIDRCYQELVTYKNLVETQVILSGNHDERLHKAIATNLLAAAGLRVAAADPTEWPALSVPTLLRLRELGIEYIGSHPAGAYWLNDNVVCVHGRWIGSSSRRAVIQALEDERVTVLFGHTHRLEMAVKTRSLRDRPTYHAAWAAGCLCRIDGAVPSTRGGYRPGNRGPVRAWEDWQQGLLVVSYEEGDGRFLIEPVFIFENQPAVWRDNILPGRTDE